MTDFARGTGQKNRGTLKTGAKQKTFETWWLRGQWGRQNAAPALGRKLVLLKQRLWDQELQRARAKGAGGVLRDPVAAHNTCWPSRSASRGPCVQRVGKQRGTGAMDGDVRTLVTFYRRGKMEPLGQFGSGNQ